MQRFVPVAHYRDTVEMKIVFMILVTTILIGCGSYKGNAIWRRSTCQSIVDDDERARCLEQATRSESDYRQDVEEATGD